jgi:tetratricopeptide (TPR) repeat protein
MDPQADQVLEEAADELVAGGRPERAAEARAFLSELWWSRGQQDRSFEQLERARALVEAGETEARVRVFARLGRQQMLAGQDDEAIATGRDVLEIAERLGLDELHGDILNTIGSARFQRGDAGGMADLERSVEITSAIDSPTAAIAYNNLGTMYLYSGDVRRDRELREASMRVGERFGDTHTIRFERGVMNQHAYFEGRWDDAMRGADAFIAECEAGAPHYLEPTARQIRALIALSRDEEEVASSEALLAEKMALQAKDPQIVTPAIAVRLRIEAELGNLDRGADLAAAILDLQPRVEWFAPATELALVAERFGITEAARAWTEGIHITSKWSDAALLILDGDFARAADLFAEIGSLGDEARMRVLAGDPTNVSTALDFYRGVGATRYIREAESALAASA